MNAKDCTELKQRQYSICIKQHFTNYHYKITTLKLGDKQKQDPIDSSSPHLTVPDCLRSVELAEKNLRELFSAIVLKIMDHCFG